MQTFLPYANMRQSLECLDRQRLGKQRVESKQILDTLNPASTKRGWINHPAVRMWRGYEDALTVYYNTNLLVWELRGYKNDKLKSLRVCSKNFTLPPWFGDEKFHASHRSNLLRKKPEYYGKFGWHEPSDLDYVWPVL